MQENPGTPTGGRPTAASDTSKLLAALGYPLWLPVAIIALLIDPYKDEPFTRFHAMQGLALGLAASLLSVILGMTVILAILSVPLGIAVLVYQIVLAIKAYNGEYFEVPIISGFVHRYVH